MAIEVGPSGQGDLWQDSPVVSRRLVRHLPLIGLSVLMLAACSSGSDEPSNTPSTGDLTPESTPGVDSTDVMPVPISDPLDQPGSPSTVVSATLVDLAAVVHTRMTEQLEAFGLEEGERLSFAEFGDCQFLPDAAQTQEVTALFGDLGYGSAGRNVDTGQWWVDCSATYRITVRQDATNACDGELAGLPDLRMIGGGLVSETAGRWCGGSMSVEWGDADTLNADPLPALPQGDATVEATIRTILLGVFNADFQSANPSTFFPAGG